MNEDAKANITVKIRNKTFYIITDEKAAKNVLNAFISQDSPAIVSADVSSNYNISPKSPSDKSKLKVPERSLIKKFIESQPNYMFTIDDLVRQFEGRNSSDFKSIEEIKYLNALRAKVFRARRDIEIAENGKWIEEYRNHQKVYKFIKDSGGEDKQQTKDTQNNFNEINADVL